MGKVRIKWNRKAWAELRTLPAVQADIDRRAEAVAAACGEGFEAVPAQEPRKRARRIVSTQTAEAKRRNSIENTLLRNLDAGA